ncbi:MAG: hypothetical protein GY809_25110 [Planctomycetes bacterium]|nr:hypothetical protein [Planctomycetota bacterium]
MACTHAPSGSRTPVLRSCVVESDALAAQCTSADPELAELNENWQDLPDHIRQAIQALVNSV